MRVLTVSMVAFALFCGVVHAQEPAGIPDNIIKELDSLVGTWETEGKVGDKVQTGKFTCRWVRTEDKKKVCLIGHFSHSTEGAARSGVTLIGWNAAKKCIEDRGFDANGGNAVLYWTLKSSTEWHGDVRMVVNGEEAKSKNVLVKKGPSEIVIESESEEGEASRWVFRKVADTVDADIYDRCLLRIGVFNQEIGASEDIDREIEKLLAQESGWLIFNTHGLDDEGWGPIRSSYLEQLLERLLAIESVGILPAGRALDKYSE